MDIRTYFIWIGLGGRGLETLERCVTFDVPSWYRSRAYVGFFEFDDWSVCKRAKDIFHQEFDFWLKLII